MDLKWCMKCRSPLIYGSTCPICSEMSQKVSYTPPGDIRPAFIHDIREVITTGDWEFFDVGAPNSREHGTDTDPNNSNSYFLP